MFKDDIVFGDDRSVDDGKIECPKCHKERVSPDRIELDGWKKYKCPKCGIVDLIDN